MTRSCRSGRTLRPPASVREAVIGLTPARRATSLMVGWRAPRDVDMPALLRLVGRSYATARTPGESVGSRTDAAGRPVRVRFRPPAPIGLDRPEEGVPRRRGVGSDVELARGLDQLVDGELAPAVGVDAREGGLDVGRLGAEGALHRAELLDAQRAVAVGVEQLGDG